MHLNYDIIVFTHKNSQLLCYITKLADILNDFHLVIILVEKSEQ